MKNSKICTPSKNITLAWAEKTNRAFVLAFVFFSLAGMNPKFYFITLKISLFLSLALLLIKWKKERLNKIGWTGTIVLLPFISSILTGFIKKTPGFESEIPLFILAPLTFIIIFSQAYKGSFKKNLMAICILAVIYHLTLFYFLYFFHNEEFSMVFQKLTSFTLQSPDGFIKIFSTQATQFGFLLPVLIVSQIKNSSMTGRTLLTACTVMALLLSRKVIIFEAIILYFVIFVCSFYNKGLIFPFLKNLIFPVFLGISIFFLVINKNPHGYVNSLYNATYTAIYQPEKKSESAKNSNYKKSVLGHKETSILAKSESAENVDHKAGMLRHEQFLILANEIRSNPIIGKGAGYVIHNYLRSETLPWRFEATWLALIMDIGLPGVLIIWSCYSYWILNCISTLRKKSRFSNITNINKSFFNNNPIPTLALLAGSVMFVNMSWTNPYIMSVETIWILFLPYLLMQREN